MERIVDKDCGASRPLLSINKLWQYVRVPSIAENGGQCLYKSGPGAESPASARSGGLHLATKKDGSWYWRFLSRGSGWVKLGDLGFCLDFVPGLGDVPSAADGWCVNDVDDATRRDQVAKDAAPANGTATALALISRNK